MKNYIKLLTALLLLPLSVMAVDFQGGTVVGKWQEWNFSITEVSEGVWLDDDGSGRTYTDEFIKGMKAESLAGGDFNSVVVDYGIEATVDEEPVADPIGPRQYDIDIANEADAVGAYATLSNSRLTKHVVENYEELSPLLARADNLESNLNDVSDNIETVVRDIRANANITTTNTNAIEVNSQNVESLVENDEMFGDALVSISSNVVTNRNNIADNTTSIENNLILIEGNALSNYDNMKAIEANLRGDNIVAADLYSLKDTVASIGASDYRLKEFYNVQRGEWINGNTLTPEQAENLGNVTWKYLEGTDAYELDKGQEHHGYTAQEWATKGEYTDNIVKDGVKTKYLKVDTLSIVSDHRDMIEQNAADIKGNTAGIAGALASDNVTYSQKEGVSISVGVGNYNGETAVAVGGSVRKNRLAVRVSLSYDSQKNVGTSAGVTWQF